MYPSHKHYFSHNLCRTFHHDKTTLVWAFEEFLQVGPKGFFQGGQHWKNFIAPTRKLRKNIFLLKS